MGSSLAGRFGGSLAGAESVFNSLSDNEAIRTDSIVGIGRGKFLCPRSARELFFISSCVGHRTNFSVVEKSSIHVSGISDFHVMWGGNDIIAHSHVDAFDEGMTRKTADRKLVWSTLPQYVVCMSGEAVSGWGAGQTNPDDLLVPVEIDSWATKKIGGKTYFLYPEKGVVLGACRGVSMSILSEHFSRFPGFSETVRKTSPHVWSAVQEAMELEGGLAGATRGATSKVPHTGIAKAALWTIN